MKISILSFSIKGCILSDKIEVYLEEEGHSVFAYALEKFAAVAGKIPFQRLEVVTARIFYETDVIIFIGSCETAVRTITPFLRSKVVDPAVVVLDEEGTNVIALLSGQKVTANELGYSLADQLNANPVITSGSPIAGVFSVEAFAKKNHLNIVENVLAREISNEILRGEPVGFECDYFIEGKIPKSLGSEGKESGVFVSTDLLSHPFEKTLHLVPKNIIIGLVCSPGTKASDIEQFIYANLQKYQIPLTRVGRICSIYQLDEEPGIVEVAGSLNVKYQTYAEETLREVSANYSGKDNIGDIFNIDYASERCAVRGSHGGKLVIKKQERDGIAMAAAVKKLTIRF